MKETLKLGAILLVFALVSAGVLGFVNGITAPIISEREAEEAKQAYQKLLPEAQDFEDIVGEEFAKYKANNSKLDKIVKATNNGEVIGYLITTNGGGYGGDITVITAIVGEEVKAITVLKHKETPQIGTKVENPDFQAQFSGKKIGEPIVAKKDNLGPNDIQAISGSSVSSKGVTAAVNMALDVYKEIQNGL